MKKINILVINLDTIGGVGFYRSRQPHEKLVEMYPDKFNVVFDESPNFSDLESFKMFDIINIHKGIFQNDEQFIKAMKFFKENNIITIIDIDDHWKLDFRHPQNQLQKILKNDEKIKRNLSLADYVTTTTPLFKSEILKFNKNVKVFPNSIDNEDDRFLLTKEKSNKLRFGFVMGSTHEYDLMIMNGFLDKLPKEVRDKIEIVLCGFDTRGTVKIYDENNNVQLRPMNPKETVWYRYEKMLTNNYTNISLEYKNFLNNFIPNSEYSNHEEEGYRRCWTMDINNYYKHYSKIDVLLAPLDVCEFNKVKSQLKVIEAAFSNTAIIASNFGPYTIDLKSIFVKGGDIDKTGNAILIDETKNHKDWSKAIEKLVKNPELVQLLKDNLRDSICEKYNLKTQTEQRALFYTEIIKK